MKAWLGGKALLHPKNEKYISISFLVIALISIATVLYYDHRMRAETIQERAYSYERKHEKAFSSLYLFTRQSTAIYYQHLLEPNLNGWLRNPGALTEDMYKLSVLQNSFVRTIQSQSGLESVYLHNNQNRLILSTSFMISALPEFPHREIFETYYESGRPSMWVPTEDGEHDRLLGKDFVSLVFGIPNKLPDKDGAIALNFDQNYIRNEVLDRSDSFIWLDADNSVIMADNPEYLQFYLEHREPLLGTNQSSFFLRDYFAIRSESPDGSWKLLTIVPEAALRPARSDNATLLSLVLLFGLLAAVLPNLYFYYSRRMRDRWYQGRVASNLPDLQTGFVNDLLSGKPLPDLYEKAAEYQVDITSGSFRVIVFQIDDYYNHLLTKPDHEKFLMNKIIFNAIKWTFKLKFNAYVINSEFAKISALVTLKPHETEAEIHPLLMDAIRYIQDDIQNHYGLTVCAGISEPVRSVLQIHDAYAHALLALDYKSVYGRGSVIEYERLPERTSSRESVHFNEQMQRLAASLGQGRMDSIEQTVDKLIEDMIGRGPAAADRLHALFSNMLSNVMKFALEQRIDLYQRFKEDLFFTLYSYEFVNEKKAYLLSVCEYVTEQLRTEPAEKNGTAEWVIEYIDKHYDQPISLGILADKISMSSSYLSALIKSHLGIGFVEYISRLRIQKAVRLLEDDSLSINEIAEQCGYDTIHTFIRQFKKVYKLPPNEYRKMQKRVQG